MRFVLEYVKAGLCERPRIVEFEGSMKEWVDLEKRMFLTPLKED